jgi:hypothetical protein
LLVLAGNPDHSSKTKADVPLSPISVAAPPANAAANIPCTNLLGDLPTAIPISKGTIPGRPAQSTWTYVAAWGDPAIVLRCGVPRPKQLTVDSSDLLILTNGVNFLPVSTGTATVFTTVDRAAYIELTVPKSYAQPPLGPIATAIAKALPAVCTVGYEPTAAGTNPLLCTHRK